MTKQNIVIIIINNCISIRQNSRDFSFELFFSLSGGLKYGAKSKEISKEYSLRDESDASEMIYVSGHGSLRGEIPREFVHVLVHERD